MFDPLSIVIITWKQPEWSTVVDYSWKKNKQNHVGKYLLYSH